MIPLFVRVTSPRTQGQEQRPEGHFSRPLYSKARVLIMNQVLIVRLPGSMVDTSRHFDSQIALTRVVPSGSPFEVASVVPFNFAWEVYSAPHVMSRFRVCLFPYKMLRQQ